MKRFVYFIIAFICLFGNAVMAQTAKQKVAVYVTGEAESGYKKVIGSKLVSSITRSESFAAVERTSDFLSALNQEHDYQTSGAVSDNQIVRLGQQFGVRYVLVADVSEVFESMFISARMIDVQTGQITNSAEASLVVNSMDGLTELSENVIAGLIDGSIRTNGGNRNGLNVNDIKIIGPLSYVELPNYKQYIPTNYHIASKEEIEALIANYTRTNKAMAFPIYAGLSIVQYDERKTNYTSYHKSLTAVLFKDRDMQVEFSNKNYHIDSDDNKWYGEYSDIIPGYIYLIKNN